ncbi:MAG: MgtC/SapB family protein [Gammaproteobacteria bacterium]|nr:MgtC/SapB family protein [Gammaproteobacteria bacterium]NIR83968.1 MgtC/SapB family protein [Gammaproteobacteria bacterium]NIR89112.1 MgtC/SapB family protein [Gammaproteobacteria bacterium]NIU04914.1 MgtC/SapB family protein [Gammaproteobacteria bacterium]NIV52080.1 DUF4010 domain-containing protein [Gammaproteobacteria bacterium]
MDDDRELFLLGLALVLGLLIGVERGWKEREAERGTRIAGVRTYGLIGLLGGATALAALRLHPWILGFGFLALAATVITAYVVGVRRRGDVGITSLIASLLTFSFGALAVLDYVVEASAAAVVTALVLGFKPALHRWVGGLQREELQAGLKLLLISVVLLPILPSRGYGPWHALNPYEIWWMVVLIAVVSFVGYFAMKIGGTTRGAALTGLFAGLASSTALTVHFSRAAKHEPEAATALAAGVLLACGTMFPRVVLVSSVVNPHLFQALLAPAAAMALVVYAPALMLWRRAQDAVARTSPTLGNPLELGAALRFGALLGAIMVLAAGLEAALGDAGVLILSAASGIADVDAITLSLAQMSQAELSPGVAVAGIVIAAGVNSIVKGLLAAGIGGTGLALRVAVPLLLAAVAGLLVVWLTP